MLEFFPYQSQKGFRFPIVCKHKETHIPIYAEPVTADWLLITLTMLFFLEEKETWWLLCSISPKE